MSNIVKWGTYEDDTAQQEADALAQSGSGAKFYKFKPGKNVIRFMPPLGKKSPFKTVWEHAINLPNGGFTSFACPRLESKQPCIVCAKSDQLKSSANPADAERAKELFAKRRVYANIIDREHPEEGPIVCAFGKTIHEPLVALRTDPDAGGDFTHPETGFDIIIERKGSGKNDTEYKVFAARKSMPLGNLDWIDVQVNLDGFGKLLTPEEMRAKVTGGAAPAKTDGAAPEKTVEGQAVRAAPSRAAPQRTVENDTVNGSVSDGDVPF